MWRESDIAFGDGESESSDRPSTAASSRSYMTAKSASSAWTDGNNAVPQPPPAAGAASAQAQIVPSSNAPQLPAAVSVLPALLTDLNGADSAADEAALHLCLLLDSAAGDEAVALGDALRASGARGLPRIVALLGDATRGPRAHQSCLLLLANLAAPDIDPFGLIAAELKALDALSRLIAHVTPSADVLSVAYALGAIRNNATTAAEVHRLQQAGTIDLMQALANGAREAEDPAGRLRQYAAGCLINVRQILQAG